MYGCHTFTHYCAYIRKHRAFLPGEGKVNEGNVKQLTRGPGIEFLISPSSLNDWRSPTNGSLWDPPAGGLSERGLNWMVYDYDRTRILVKLREKDAALEQKCLAL
ncbi:hypothetical protein HOY82DRAFT_579201 [Tuber indicum]|nr:hypothetical protein HOY82DRAFT_579201 [Tuber indicum]